MVSYFPTPYPGEIFYSLIARFYNHLSADRAKEFLIDLFNSSHVTATLDFPSHLNAFVFNTNAVLHKSVDQIISEHTLLPLYAPFISAENLKKITSSMRTKSGDIHTRIGINAGIFSPISIPRYCPICFKIDTETHGESYWHRDHQIPSFDICPKHFCKLFEVQAEFKVTNSHFFIPATKSTCAREDAILCDNEQITKIINLLLTYLSESSNYNRTKYYYKEKLFSASFIKGNRINQLELSEAFKRFYSQETLKYFRSEVNYHSPSCWLKAATRKMRKTMDPIRHTLLEYFLEYHLSATTSNKFDNKFWECLNPVCSLYKKPVIKNIEIHNDYKAKRKIGLVYADLAIL